MTSNNGEMSQLAEPWSSSTNMVLAWLSKTRNSTSSVDNVDEMIKLDRVHIEKTKAMRCVKEYIYKLQKIQ